MDEMIDAGRAALWTDRGRMATFQRRLGMATNAMMSSHAVAVQPPGMVALPNSIAVLEKVRKETFYHYILTTEMRQTENSTDLDMGRRPELNNPLSSPFVSS